MPSTGAPLTAHQIFHLLSEVRRTRPVIHNITNFVAMNFTANALLALGASPVMAHAQEEIRDMAKIAQSVVVNMGTLDSSWVESMKCGLASAAELGRPVVLDPVGAGATPFRTQIAAELAASGPVTVIRGNASEILALATSAAGTRGVDSQITSFAARFAAQELSMRYHCVTCISGETDVIVERQGTVALRNGHPLMARVTAMGCAASSVIGAFLAVQGNCGNNGNPGSAFHATQAAMATLSIAGELAAEMSDGPGTFQMKFLDALSQLKLEDFIQRVQWVGVI